MNAAVKSEAVKTGPVICFFTGTSFTIDALDESGRDLGRLIKDLAFAHRQRIPASIKMSAEQVATKANQIAALATHLAGKTAEHVNRKPRNGSAS